MMHTKKELNNLIGKALRKARKSKKISQDVLADRLGVDRSTISKYETGDNPINMSVFIQICEIIGVDYRDVMDGI